MDTEKSTIEDLLTVARAEIRRFSPAQAREAMGSGALLVDIRPLEQRVRDGLVPGARVVDRNVLEWRLDPRCAYRDPSLARPDRQVILICNQGYQSSLVAAQLQRLGLACGDVIGGVEAWSQVYPRFAKTSRWWSISSFSKQTLLALMSEVKACRMSEPTSLRGAYSPLRRALGELSSARR